MNEEELYELKLKLLRLKSDKKMCEYMDEEKINEFIESLMQAAYIAKDIDLY